MSNEDNESNEKFRPMYIPTIGLEIHAELKTKTKMFCSCKNDPDEKKPNTNVCPVCLGHPGTLPVINKSAVELMIKIGLALRGKITSHSQFDRKSYFYPDLPKGYQISQYEHPIVQEGFLRDVRITRVHLEEDAGRLVHSGAASYGLQAASLVDFNRAGLPLMELVTEPDIHNADEAVSFAKSLQEILRYLDASDANMEKGQMRIEANVSIAKEETKLGTKVEVKNINSFKAVHDAIRYEIERQSGLLDEGKKIIQETRGWDDVKNTTVSQRAKEEANDYRYFPDPDLPPLDLSVFEIKKIKGELPELPDEKRYRFIEEYALSKDLIEILVSEREFADYFEEAASELRGRTTKPDYRLLANYITSDLRGLINAENGMLKKTPPEHLAHLVFLIQEGKLTSRLAKDLLAKMSETGDDPENLMKSEGMEALSDEGELRKIIEEVIIKNEKSAADYKKGKQNALQFLIGQVMAKTKGKAEPGLTKTILEKLLKEKFLN